MNFQPRTIFQCTFNLIKSSYSFSTSSLRCQAIIIDGKKIANDIQLELKNDIIKLENELKRRPSLVAILVGDDAASSTYVNNKMRTAEKL